MALPDTGTLLVLLNGMGVPLFSARNVTHTYAPIPQAAILRRTINSRLDDLSEDQFKRYKTELSCTDIRPPQSVWPGLALTMHCAFWFNYPTGGSPERDAVPGSSFTEEDFVFYRPILEVRVTSGPSVSFAEWTADYQWTMGFEERE